MKLVAISSGLVCLALGAMSLAGCGAGAAAGSMPAADPSAAQPQAAAEAQPQTAAPSPAGVDVASSCGESTRPEVHRWQSEMLKAIGRDGQYELFDYVFVDGSVYVGLRTASLGLGDAELDALRQASTDFSPDQLMTRDNGNLLMVSAFAMPQRQRLARSE